MHFNLVTGHLTAAARAPHSTGSVGSGRWLELGLLGVAEEQRRESVLVNAGDLVNMPRPTSSFDGPFLVAGKSCC